MNDIPIQYQETRKENYWCEQDGEFVNNCNGKNQCWDCALIQSEKEYN